MRHIKKRSFLLGLLFPVFMPLAKMQDNMVINGSFDFKDSVEKIYVTIYDGNGNTNKNVVINKNKFLLQMQITEPVLSYMTVRFKPEAGQTKPRYEKIPIFLEPGKINVHIKDSLKFAQVTGSRSQKDYERLMKLQQPYDLKSMELRQKNAEYYKEKNKAGMEEINESLDALETETQEQVYYPFFLHNLKSPIALHVLKLYAGYDIDAKKIEPMFNKLSAATRKTPSGIAFKERIETAKKTGVGVMAMNFTQNDTLDKPVSLASFKGKYVLLDFWASWCGPCRAENPNVVKNFNEYKDKNFTVLSVSLDQPGKKQAWLDAIHKDGLTWTHVSDLKFWNNDVAKLYGIRAIPQNLLIDPTGKIIAKNIRGEELSKKLGELIKD